MLKEISILSILQSVNGSIQVERDRIISVTEQKGDSNENYSNRIS